MAYQSEISRDHPTCILFIIDQSGSMTDSFDGGRSKADFVADVLNKTLYTLTINCTKADGVRAYFDIGVIGYGGPGVSGGFGGVLASSIIHPISAVANSPLRVEDRNRKVDDGAGGVIDQRIKFPVWFDAVGSGGTPMRAALTQAAEHLAEWCDTHPNSYPPTILHVTDGASTDGDPSALADAIRGLATQDGECLLFNLHVSTSTGKEVLFPTNESGLSDPYAELLFLMSSILPTHVAKFARDRGYKVDDGARGFVFNGDPKCIVDFFDIGTRPRLISDR